MTDVANIPEGVSSPSVEASEDGRFRLVMDADFYNLLVAAEVGRPVGYAEVREDMRRDYPDYYEADAARKRAVAFVAGSGVGG